ncbi:MAG TPA: SWIM zinc finger family protein [Thermomicrobiales bacterium]|nr:SWIM zinc finger family protein [Thermomicrobiales bacterium]
MSTSSKSTLPTLTPNDVAAMTDSGSFSRGQTYQRNGAIYDAMREGFVLTAWCEGSSGGPYHVRAELANLADPDLDENLDSAIVDWACTCPRGGFCKHIVALLLTWIEDPDAFDAMPPLAELLAGKTREDLITLLDQLATSMPGLEREILRRVPVPVVIPPHTPGAGKTPSVDLGAIRRKADRALAPMQIDPWNDYDEPFDATSVAVDLEKVRAIGDQYAEAGRWADAQAIYTAVAERAMAQYNDTFDVNGEILWVIDACEVGLLRVLEVQRDLPAADRLPSIARRDLLEAAFRVWRFGVGGDPAAPVIAVAATAKEADTPAPAPTERINPNAFYADMDWSTDASEDADGVTPVTFDLAATLTTIATAEERALVESWLRGLLTQPGATYGRENDLCRAAIQMQFDLRHRGASKEAKLDAYKAAGLWVEAIVLLVELGQIHDAVALASRTLVLPHHATAFADFLIRQNRDFVPQAIAFVEDRLWETEGKQPHQDQVYQTWLTRIYGQHAMPEKAFAVELRRFKDQPTIHSYAAVQQTAALPGQAPDLWERTRPELLNIFEERKNLPALFEAHVAAGEAGAARAIVQRMEQGEQPPGDQRAVAFLGYSNTLGWRGLRGHRLRLAPLIAGEYPDEAVATYRDAAEQQIELRQRTAYRQAAEYLSEARKILVRTGREDEWARSISTLRETYKRLPALQQELDAKNLR